MIITPVESKDTSSQRVKFSLLKQSSSLDGLCVFGIRTQLEWVRETDIISSGVCYFFFCGDTGADICISWRSWFNTFTLYNFTVYQGCAPSWGGQNEIILTFLPCAFGLFLPFSFWFQSVWHSWLTACAFTVCHGGWNLTEGLDADKRWRCG